jgi:hypothetical protein
VRRWEETVQPWPKFRRSRLMLWVVGEQIPTTRVAFRGVVVHAEEQLVSVT